MLCVCCLYNIWTFKSPLYMFFSEGRKRQMTVKYHMMRRQMTPSGAPHRKLTWSAIEQIR